MDGDFFVRSKAYPTKILDLNQTDFEHNGKFWKRGTVSLSDHAHGNDNQKWNIVNSEIVCNYLDLRLAISWDFQNPVKSRNGSNVGCFKQNDGCAQKWEIMILYQNQILTEDQFILTSAS